MPRHCIVPGCRNDNRKDPEIYPEILNIRFYPLPKDETSRLRWLENVGRRELEEKLKAKVRENDKFDVKYYSVCSKHFVDTYPSTEYPYPTLFDANHFQHPEELSYPLENVKVESFVNNNDNVCKDGLMTDSRGTPAEVDETGQGSSFDGNDESSSHIQEQDADDEEVSNTLEKSELESSMSTTPLKPDAVNKTQTLMEQLALIPESPSRSKEPVMVKLQNLLPYITCGLCGGYLYEASTITECMHSFCKTCIVRHTERHLNCPSCDTPIHPTDPFVHIRNDSTIQDIVYRLLPNIAEEEQKREKEFYEKHERETGVQITPKLTLPPPPPKTPPPRAPFPQMPVRPPKLSHKVKSEQKQKQLASYRTHFVSLLLEYIGDQEEYDDELTLSKKFIRVTGKATIGNVATFIRKKLNLGRFYTVDIFLTQDDDDDDDDVTQMPIDRNLQSIKEDFYGGKDCVMELQYKISQEQ